jgi:phage FluMu protein gp41
MTDNSSIDLEEQFDKAMIALYETTIKELHYNASYFIQMFAEHRGVKTAKKLLLASNVSYGFTMVRENQRLDLSVEALVL